MKISRDLSSGTLHPRENLFVTGGLALLNAEVIAAGDGAASVALDVRGTFVGTIEVSYTTDGVNYILLPVRSSLGGIYVVSVTAAGNFVATLPPCRNVRARMIAYTSGTATTNLVVTPAPLDQTLMGAVTPSIATAVGASGAAVTLSIASPGAGLRHYLTYLSINRFAAAVLTAAAAPVTVTTANLPGSLAFSFAADAALLGTMDRWREDFAFPIASSAQATITSITCPITTGVIWRITAGFYVAP